MGGTSRPFCVKGSVIWLPREYFGATLKFPEQRHLPVIYVAKFEEAYGFCNRLVIRYITELLVHCIRVLILILRRRQGSLAHIDLDGFLRLIAHHGNVGCFSRQQCGDQIEHHG